jgi:hypothetical protein
MVNKTPIFSGFFVFILRKDFCIYYNMILKGKEILALSALLAEKLTQDLSEQELYSLKLLISQLNCDINTLYSSKLLETVQKQPKKQ